MQAEYISCMIKNLPVLRASIGFTQEQLGTKLGVSRQTIVVIEDEKIRSHGACIWRWFVSSRGIKSQTI
jgi:predicted transcriptional regulator